LREGILRRRIKIKKIYDESGYITAEHPDEEAEKKSK
jgi:hypothetical protein